MMAAFRLTVALLLACAAYGEELAAEVTPKQRKLRVLYLEPNARPINEHGTKQYVSWPMRYYTDYLRPIACGDGVPCR